MHHSITFTETDYSSLIDHIFQYGSTEQAAYTAALQSSAKIVQQSLLNFLQ